MNASNRRIESTIFEHYKYEVLNYAQWLWHCRARLYLLPIGAVLFSLFALCVVMAQIAIFIPAVNFLNPFSHLLSIRSFVGLDLLLLLVLGYMAFCVYYALFNLKFSNFYGLYWNHQTDAASLIFFAMYVLAYSETARVSPTPSTITSCKWSRIPTAPLSGPWGRFRF